MEQTDLSDIICKLQTMLEESRKLSYLGTMATAVTHELSQPVGIIRAATSAARDDIRDKLFRFEDIEPLLDQIWGQTKRLNAVIENFRRFARGDRSSREPVNINEVIEQAIAFFGKQFRHHNINLVKQLCRDTRVPVTWANPFQLEEVIINLLTNASDAVEGQKNAFVRVKTWQHGEKTGFQVEDNGPGIPPEFRVHIFVPFFSTKSPEQGTGIGLYISHKIIDDLGGSIQYEEGTDGGACFTVSLPLLKEGDK